MKTQSADSAKIGNAMLEFIIAFPVVLLCVLVVIQFALLFAGRLVVQHAAYSAARAGLVHQGDSALWAESGGRRFSFEGMTARGGRVQNEAQLAACEAAAATCALLTMGACAGDDAESGVLAVPGWGGWVGSASARKRTRAWLGNHYPDFRWPAGGEPIDSQMGALNEWSRWPSQRNEWNVYAVVEHDFDLIVPVAGRLLAWGCMPFGFESSMARGDPSLRLVETCVLPKPYKSVVPTER